MKPHPWAGSVLRTALTCSLMLSAASAQIVVDPSGGGSATTIAGGLALATPGATIDVLPGTYFEAPGLLMPAFPVTLRSTDGPELTIVDGSLNTAPILTVPAGVQLTTVISGFTLRSASIVGYGGAILCDGGSPTITNNRILCNFASLGGGGIACLNGASPLILDNLLFYNTTEGLNGEGGGGILCRDDSRAEIRFNRILHNRGLSMGSEPVTELPAGGGIASVDSAPLIRGNELWANSVWIGSNGAGGGLAIHGDGSSGPATVYANRLYDNEAVHGAGVAVSGGATANFWNNVYSRNRTDDRGGQGGGVLVSSGDPTFHHETLYDNVSDDGAGVKVLPGGQTTLRNCIVWGNKDLSGTAFVQELSGSTSQLVIESCNVGDTNWLPSDPIGASFSADPFFVDPDALDQSPGPGEDFAPFTRRDLHVMAAKMGLPSAVRHAAVSAGTAEADWELDPHLAPCDPAPDVGADEFFSHLYVIGGVDQGPRTTVEEGTTMSVRVTGEPGRLALIGMSSALLPAPLPHACETGWWLDLNAPGVQWTVPLTIPASGVLILPAGVPAGLAGSSLFAAALVGTSSWIEATPPVQIRVVAPGGNALPNADCQ